MSTTEKQQVAQPSVLKAFYLFGPIVASIIMAIVYWKYSNPSLSIGVVFISIFYGIPGAYIGLGIAIIAKALFSGSMVYGSVGYVLQAKLLFIFAPMIGMILGSFLTIGFGVAIFHM
ncbi:hypothetical protein LJC15_03975 [Desulfovibrio sp. OttesenSCG-928-G11]|nr:hypothetical protein [Desulfovibrio sp. OttesenSCG-928-G11]